MINKLSLDMWDGPKVTEVVTVDPVWEQFEAAVRSLDGERHTLVTVDGQDETEMLIGGGNENYVVSVATSTGDLFTLSNPTAKKGGSILLKAGGQYGNYPIGQVVEIAQAIQAARWFFEHNEPAPHLPWTQ